MADQPRRPHGITFACAEQTACSLLVLLFGGDYLRVCGADRVGQIVTEIDEGLPSRVRSRQLYFTVF